MLKFRNVRRRRIDAVFGEFQIGWDWLRRRLAVRFFVFIEILINLLINPFVRCRILAFASVLFIFRSRLYFKDCSWDSQTAQARGYLP